ncbi:hypothetical protein SPAN111604_05560 [Sphingomonas antarctica]
MATNPITALPSVPPMPAVSRILARFDRRQVEGFISVAIDLLDTLDGDAENEDGGDDEPDDDWKGDQSFAEWHTRGRHKLSPFGAEHGNTTCRGFLEDTEADDHAEDDDPESGIEDQPHDAEEDCGAEEAGEREQMMGDVLTLPCFAIEPDPETGRRPYVGHTNLLSTFQCGSGAGAGIHVRSADSGKVHLGTRGRVDRPGTPA